MRRRRFLVCVLLAGCASAGKRGAENSLVARDDSVTFVYAGGTNGDIQIFQLDRISGRLTARGTSSAGRSVSSLVADRQGRFLYASAENSGDIAAFAIRARTGALVPLGKAGLRATGANGLTLHRNGKYLLVAGGGGNVVVFPVLPDGRLGTAESYPSGAAAQAVALNPQLDFAFVLTPAGISQFAFNTGTGILTPSRDPPVTLPARSNPRRIAFHPSGRFAYIVQEATGLIAGHGFEPTSGTLSVLAFQTISMAPAPAPGTETKRGKSSKIRDGELQVTPRFLYAVDRAHDTVATFAIDETGGLSLVSHQQARGQPRALAVVEGKLNPILLLAHQSALSSFHVDASTGALAHTETKDLRVSPAALAAVTVRPE